MRRRFTFVRAALVFLIGAGAITGTGLVIDRVCLRHGIPGYKIMLISNVVTGIIAGFLYLQNRIREREKRLVLEDRLAKVADVNHHVRNALSIVVFYGKQSGNIHAAQLVQEAVERIEWTLREILPKGWNIDSAIAENLLEKNLYRKNKAVASSRST